MSTSQPDDANQTIREGDISISGRAIGTAIARHGDEAPTMAQQTSTLHLDMQMGPVQAGALWDTLDELEEDLARIFVRRRGQIVGLEVLKHELRDSGREDASEGPLTNTRLVQVLGSLAEKLRAYRGVGRLLEVPGCGYVLWH